MKKKYNAKIVVSKYTKKGGDKMAEVYVSKEVKVKFIEDDVIEARDFGDVLIVNEEKFDEWLAYLDRNMNDCRQPLFLIGIGKFGRGIKRLEILK